MLAGEDRASYASGSALESAFLHPFWRLFLSRLWRLSAGSWLCRWRIDGRLDGRVDGGDGRGDRDPLAGAVAPATRSFVRSHHSKPI
jgi:hypothetical protein